MWTSWSKPIWVLRISEAQAGKRGKRESDEADGPAVSCDAFLRKPQDDDLAPAAGI